MAHVKLNIKWIIKKYIIKKTILLLWIQAVEKMIQLAKSGTKNWENHLKQINMKNITIYIFLIIW